MKKLLLLAAALVAASAASLADNIRFASHPSLSPDGKQVYFSYDGDIYCVPVAGGQATAVITMPGVQDSPLVSPDGKWLAFSSDIQGNNDVYVVPVAGGQAVQLTFHEAPDVPVGWSPKSDRIYFESTRESARKTTFQVAVTGGTPQRMFDGFFNTVVNLAENPKTGVFLFNESMESISFPTRKRYVGDHNPNIKSWNPRAKAYQELTDYIGKDQWPMADKDGNIYYVSDELNKESNIVNMRSMFWNRPRRRFRSRRFRLPPAASRSAGPSRDRRPRRRMSPRTGRSSRWSSVAACMYPTRNASISKSWILLRMSGWMKWSGPMTARPSTTRGRTRVGPTSSGSRPTEAPANRPYSCRKTTPRACRPTENAKSSPSSTAAAQ